MDEKLFDIYDYDCEKSCSLLISLRKKLGHIRKLAEINRDLGGFIGPVELLKILDGDSQ